MKKLLILLLFPFIMCSQNSKVSKNTKTMENTAEIDVETPLKSQDPILLHPDAVETYHPYSKNTGDTCRFCPNLTNGPYGFYLIPTGPGMCKVIVKDTDMNTVFEARGGYYRNAKLLIQEAKKDLGIL